MYYSNNYSKYIEKLKLEKSKIAFRQLVENSQEQKSPDIKIGDNILSSKNNNTTILNEESISEKRSKSIENITNAIEKTTNKIDTEDILNSIKYDDYKISNSRDEISEKTADDISIERDFKNIYPNKISVEPAFNDDKESSRLNVEEDASKKTRVNFNITDSNSSKEKNNFEFIDLDIAKEKNNFEFIDSSSSKEISNLGFTSVNLSKEESDLRKATPESAKEKKSVDKERNIVSKDDDLKIGRKEFASKDINSLIYSIKQEKKREGRFANVISEPKKNEISNLNRQYRIPWKNPKAIEEEEYAHYMKYYYYPAGSYEEINKVQSEAITDLIRTISNGSNFDSTGKVFVNSLKIATDIVDMVNLVGPAKNINRFGLAPNNLRGDLKLKNQDEPNKPNKLIGGYAEYKYGEVVGTIYSNNFTTFKEDKENSSLSFKYDKRGGNDVSENIATDSVNETKGGEDFDNFAEAEDFSEKEDEDLVFKFKLSPNDVGLPEEKNTKNLAISPGTKIEENKKFKYKNQLIEDIATESLGDEKRWYDVKQSLGKIYVIPPNTEMSENNNSDIKKNKPFVIPLQNNLTFEQITRAAAWNTISFFGRIGDVQQYSKTGNLEAINLTTKYFVDDDEFTMSYLQDIEMMYRSLVLPATDSARYLYDDNDEKNNYYYFTRPPLINIVLGNPDFDNKGKWDSEDSAYIERAQTPYHNLFTDIYSTPNSKGDIENKIFYKNFVVTNVSIDKNLNDYNYYVGSKERGEKEGHYYDTTGFTVTITALEIDENYLGSLPSFNNYEYTLKSRQTI